MGSRLAYDPAKGRLWVVCKHCERWNLSPLDERWEAIEDAERRYCESRLRVSTDNIGLARLREGLDLIRIGSAMRPEMAAWRYGDQFGRRRKRQMLVTGAVLGSAAAIAGGIAWIGVSISSFTGMYANGRIWDGLINGRPGELVTRMRLTDGELLTIQRRHARMSTLEHTELGEPMRLRLEHTKGTLVLRGAEAERAAAQLLPTVNRFGGSRASVQDAVRFLEDAGDPSQALNRLQTMHGARETDKRWKNTKQNTWGQGAVTKVPGALHTLPLPARLALEMALHEESERRAMDGELAELERAWREAEEIAKIADEMFVPASVNARIEQMHTRSSSDI